MVTAAGRLVDGDEPGLHTLVWEWPSPVNVLSSAPVGGGLRTTSWLLNIGVPLRYRRMDLEAHANEVAAANGLSGDGVALLTAADVSAREQAENEGVVADVTVGISKPTWAADPSGMFTPWKPGTINIVVQLPVALDPSAAVNAVMTATEAKTQALHEARIPGTGTASDAVAITWPECSTSDVARFAGPRSEWGSRIALAVHHAVGAGIARWQRP